MSPVVYGASPGVCTRSEIEILKTQAFSDWFTALRDRRAQRRIQARIDHLASGGFGNAKRLTSEVSKLKIDCGPGYRVYYTQRGPVVVILLCGDIAAYLDAAIEEAGDDPTYMLHVLNTIARARGMTKLASEAGLTRGGLYKALAPDAKPSIQTVHKIARALGFKLMLSKTA